MHSFKASYFNELEKISKKKKIRVAMIISLVAIAIGAILVCTANNFLGIKFTGDSEFAILMLPLFVSILIPLFTLFVCIDLFCGEANTNTLKTTLLTPSSRIKIFSAKLLAAMTFVVAMLLFAMLISFLVSVPIGQTGYRISAVLFSYLVSIFPLAVICLVTAVIANFVHGSGSAFMLSLLVILLFKALEIFNPLYASFFFTSGLDLYVLISAPMISFGKLLRLILIETGYCAMFFALGYALFEKKEI